MATISFLVTFEWTNMLAVLTRFAMEDAIPLPELISDILFDYCGDRTEGQEPTAPPTVAMLNGGTVVKRNRYAERNDHVHPGGGGETDRRFAADGQ